MSDPGDLPILVLPGSDLADVPVEPVVLHSDTVFEGRVWSITSERVELPGGEVVVRDVVRHPRAVAVMALDDAVHLVLVQQYRHPVTARLWEAPAGLRDAHGEPPATTAARELAEEAGLAAGTWNLLLNLALTPGGSDERIQIFLARDLRPAEAPDGFVATGEEADIWVGRFTLDDVVTAVLEGRVANAVLAAGALAVAAARGRGWQGLIPVDEPLI